MGQRRSIRIRKASIKLYYHKSITSCRRKRLLLPEDTTFLSENTSTRSSNCISVTMGGNKHEDETKDRGFSHYGGYAASGGYSYSPPYALGAYPPQGHGYGSQGYGYPPPGGYAGAAYPPAVGYPPVGYPTHSTPYHSGHGTGMGSWLAGGLAGAYGTHHLPSHGSHHLAHGSGYYGGGGYGHHGKFKHGKFGKHGGYKKWK